MVQSFEQEEIRVLVNLGCSTSQARVYLALNQIGTATIKSISKNSGIHRENLYKIINSMIERGLVEKEIDSTIKYHTVPPEKALHMLVTNKQEQISQLKGEVQTIVDKLERRTNCKNGIESQSSQFMVVSGRNLIIDRLKKTLSNTQVSLVTITTQKRFSQAIVEFAEGYDQALMRGVKIRLATEKHIPDKATSKNLSRLSKNPNFQVRYFSESLPTIAAVFDGKEAHVCLSISAQLSGAEGLWSNNSCFVSMAESYFEEKWAKSSVPDFLK